jgi:hypothetical protein
LSDISAQKASFIIRPGPNVAHLTLIERQIQQRQHNHPGELNVTEVGHFESPGLCGTPASVRSTGDRRVSLQEGEFVGGGLRFVDVPAARNVTATQKSETRPIDGMKHLDEVFPL